MDHGPGRRGRERRRSAIYEVFDTEPAIAGPPRRRRARRRRAARSASRACRSPTRAATAPCCSDIDLAVAPGETIAVVGATGSGKTTLVTLLTRLYDPTDGRITLDGHDLRDLTVTSLRRHVGFAFEEPSLFSASVRENLLMGKPDATEAEIADGARGRAGRLRPRPAVGPRHPHRRAGPVALRRPAPAARAGPGDHRPAARAGARRSAVGASTSTPRRPSRPRCARCSRTAPCSSSCTGRRRSRWPQRVVLLDDGRLVAVGTHHDLLETEPRYRAVLSEEAETSDGGGERAMTADRTRRGPRHRPRRRRSTSPATSSSTSGAASTSRTSRRSTGGLAGLLRSRSRALLGRPRAARTAARSSPSSVLIAHQHRLPARRAVARPARHRRRHPAAARRRRAAPSARSSPSSLARARHHRRSAPSTFNAFLLHRSAGSARTSCSTSASACSSTSSG